MFRRSRKACRPSDRSEVGRVGLGFASLFDMRRIVLMIGFIAWILSSSAVAGGNQCHGVFEPANPRRERAIEAAVQEKHEIASKISEIKGRLARYFGHEWQHPDSLSDAFAAREVLQGLERFGSLIDIQIVDTYVSVLEATQGKYEVRVPGFYIDLFMGQRPKSALFQERHWDWNIFINYFFNEASTFTFTKQTDLDYLRHILAEAQAQPSRRSLREVLEKANVSWTLKHLQHFPEIAAQLRVFSGTRSYRAIYQTFSQKVAKWRTEAEKTDAGRLLFQETINALRSFRSSNSIFDLLIFERYFELAQKHPHLTLSVSSETQMTDWKVFEGPLASGSIQNLTDFLFQNSHDAQAKAYLLRILNQMTLISRRVEGRGHWFMEVYEHARRTVDRKIPDIPAPEDFRTDLHLFTMVGDRAINYKDKENLGRMNPLSCPSIVEMVVRWNAKLGRPQSYIQESIPLSSFTHPTVSANPLLMQYLKSYFDTLKKNATISPEKIEESFRREASAPLARSTFFVFTRPGTNDLVAMVRLFDGGRLEFFNTHEHKHYNRGEELTYIERDFPHLRLPGREENLPIIELGRLLATPDAAGNSLGSIMNRVADYLYNQGRHGIVYMDGAEAAMTYYRRSGAAIVYTPEDLRISPHETPIWVLSASMGQIIHQFSPAKYSAVRLREN